MANEVINISDYLATPKVRENIVNVVGTIDAPRFISSVVSAYMANKALAECTRPSIVNAALLGESLKLSPSPQLGQYYMVPFNNSKMGRTEAQFILGYKGYIQLAIRSGQYRKLNTLAIKEGELVSWNPLTEDINVRLIEDERAREETPTAGYYAMFEYVNGFKKALYWSKEKMLCHADKYSAAFSANGYTKKIKGKQVQIVSFADYEAGNYNKADEWLYSSFWYKDFDEMALKTMLRQLISKWGIMSVDMQKAYTADMSVINGISQNCVNSTYVDDNSDEVNAEKEIAANANAAEIGFDNVIDPPPADDGLSSFAEIPSF